MVVKSGIYQHYKGNYYLVIGTAKHSETLEKLVVYMALYGEKQLWVRPEKMFAEEVVFEGETVPRFRFVK